MNEAETVSAFEERWAVGSKRLSRFGLAGFGLVFLLHPSTTLVFEWIFRIPFLTHGPL